MPRRRTIIRWLLLITLLVVVVATIFGVTIYNRFHAVPEYWRIVDVSEPTVARDAAAFEQWVTSQFTQHRPTADTWYIDMAAEDANRWLATRLPEWAANQQVDLPDWLKHPMAAVHGGRLVLAAEVRRDDFRNIISFTYQPVPGDVVSLELVEVAVGKLTVARNADGLMRLFEMLGDVDQYDARDLETFGQMIQTIPLSLNLGDGRVVDILEVVTGTDQVTLTVRTQWVGPR